MKKNRIYNFRRLWIIILFFALCVPSHATYLGWTQDKLEKYMKRNSWHAIELVESGNTEVKYHFDSTSHIKDMVFYFNTEGTCYAYSLVYELQFANELNEYLETNFIYNEKNDYYENKKLTLYYSGGVEDQIIYVTDNKVLLPENKSTLFSSLFQNSHLTP